jgi:adenine-specific DNA methylase
VVRRSSERILLEPGALDLVLTDPPYHDDVQYSELSLPLRAWARLPLTELGGEALVNVARGQNDGADEYRELLRSIFAECREHLRHNGRLIFSYANREPEAWVALFAALQDAGYAAVGCQVLHSENETDMAKRDVRACTLDLLMELVPSEGHATTSSGDLTVYPTLLRGALSVEWPMRS